MRAAVGRVDEIVVDCHEPATLAAFWGAVLGAPPAIRDAAWVTVRDERSGLDLAFQAVPEPKTGKNRLHIDVRVTDLRDATAACVALGATPVGPVVQDDAGSFQVMVDPEGHEFCLVT